MTDDWFNEYMFRLVAEKRFVPADVMDMLNQKPILLPAWDPMFLPGGIMRYSVISDA
jgi:bleomycin hydrolase